jgi:hypothetical protein
MITIHTEGRFYCGHLLKNHSRCGEEHNHYYKYEVDVTSDRLEEPFEIVTDRTKIDEYFDSFNWSTETGEKNQSVLEVSLESFVLDSLSYIRKLMNGYHKDFKIHVRVWEDDEYYAEITQAFQSKI